MGKKIIGGVVALLLLFGIFSAIFNNDEYEVVNIVENEVEDVIEKKDDMSLNEFSKQIEIFSDEQKDLELTVWTNRYSDELNGKSLNELKKYLTNIVETKKAEDLAFAKSKGFNSYDEYIKAEEDRIAKEKALKEEAERKKLLEIANSWGFKSVEQFKVFQNSMNYQKDFEKEIEKLSDEFEKAYKNASDLNKDDVMNKELNRIHNNLASFINEKMPYGVYKWKGKIRMIYESGKYEGYNGASWTKFEVDIDYGDIKFTVTNPKDLFNYIKNNNIKESDKVYFYGTIIPSTFVPESFPKAWTNLVEVKLVQITKQ